MRIKNKRTEGTSRDTMSLGEALKDFAKDNFEFEATIYEHQGNSLKEIPRDKIKALD